MGFFTKKGSIEIITELDENGPESFSDIKRVVSISDRTLTNRLEEGQEIGLIEKEEAETQRGTTLGYNVTELGKKAADIAREKQLPYLVEEKEEIEEELSDRSKKADEQLVEQDIVKEDQIEFL